MSLLGKLQRSGYPLLRGQARVGDVGAQRLESGGPLAEIVHTAEHRGDLLGRAQRAQPDFQLLPYARSEQDVVELVGDGRCVDEVADQRVRYSIGSTSGLRPRSRDGDAGRSRTHPTPSETV